MKTNNNKHNIISEIVWIRQLFLLITDIVQLKVIDRHLCFI